MAGIVRKIISKFNYKVMDKTKFITVTGVSIDEIITLIEKLIPLDICVDLRIPHPLDFDNTDKEHISLPEVWCKHNVFK